MSTAVGQVGFDLANDRLVGQAARFDAGNLNAGGFKLTNGAVGVSATDFVTVEQLEGVASGITYKPAVRVATNAGLPANTRTGNTITATANGSLNNVGIDGVTNLAIGDLVLDKNAAIGANRGWWEITSLDEKPENWTPPT